MMLIRNQNDSNVSVYESVIAEPNGAVRGFLREESLVLGRYSSYTVAKAVLRDLTTHINRMGADKVFLMPDEIDGILVYERE